jgi:hypothetical protein
MMTMMAEIYSNISKQRGIGAFTRRYIARQLVQLGVDRRQQTRRWRFARRRLTQRCDAIQLQLALCVYFVACDSFRATRRSGGRNVSEL